MRKSLIIVGLAAVILIGGFLLLFVIPEYSSGIQKQNEDYGSRVVAQDDTKPHTLLFVGDIMLDRSVKIRSNKATGPLNPFLLIASTTREADLTIANLEGPISARGVNQGSIYSFRFQPTSTIQALQFAGIDVVSLANNHIWDYGITSASDTMSHLNSAGIDYIGFGRNYEEANNPVIRNIASTTIAFLGYTPFYSKALRADAGLGLSAYDPINIVTTIKSLRSWNDIIVINMHWGEEYETHSRAWQQEVAHKFIDAGADLVIGHHPHVVQEIERYKNGYIAYSLGNFIFDQAFSEETMQGLMIKVTIKNKKIIDFKELPIQLTSTFQPYLAF